MAWKREIAAWGNSLGIRIPNKVFQKTNFKEGDAVTVVIQDENAVLLKRDDSQSSGGER